MRRAKASITAAIPPSLALAGLLTGCLSTYPVQRPVTQTVVEQLESDALYRTTKVYLSVTPSTDGAAPGPSSTERDPAQTMWVKGQLEGANLREVKLDIPGHGQRRIRYADIQHIDVTNHPLGFAEGVSGGVLGGVALGGLLAALNTGLACTGHYDSSAYPSASNRLFAFGLTCGILGGSVGALLGVVLGHRTTFTF